MTLDSPLTGDWIKGSVLKIGDFSKLSRVSIKTLRYYEEMELLSPTHVDPSSGYRYYSVDLLPRLYRILVLKDLGFPLNQIGRMLDQQVQFEELRGMYLLREAEQRERVEQEQTRLEKLRERLRLIEKEMTMPNDVLVKQAPAQWVASIRGVVPTYTSVGILFQEAWELLGPENTSGVPVAFWHDMEFREKDIDAEAGIFLSAAIPEHGKLKVYQLPEATVASVVHHGSYNRLNEAYNSLLCWVGKNGYKLAGPTREIYLKASYPVRPDDESYITEIQAPVEKA